MVVNFRPFMVLTPVRTIQDGDKGDEKSSSPKSSEVSVYDAVVSPSVITLGAKDPGAKDAVG
jgi:hypothetical protein